MSLRTAVEKGEGMLDKEATSYDDIFDAFRLAMKMFYFKCPFKCPFQLRYQLDGEPHSGSV